jgi:hypothetical protein
MFCVEQRELICSNFEDYVSWKKFSQKFCKKYLLATWPHKRTKYGRVKNLSYRFSAGENLQKLIFFSGEVLFALSGSVNGQNRSC